MDSKALKILKALSGNIPISEQPFLELARGLGMSEDEVIQRIRVLQESGALKRIAPFSTTTKPGTSSTPSQSGQLTHLG